MAPGIAAWCASGGAEVEVAGRTLARARATAIEAQKLLHDASGSLHASPIDSGGFASADLIIEAVVEDRAVKVALLSQLDNLASSGAVLATNTSSLSVHDLGMTVGRKEFLGLHFMYPAHLTPLVEVIPTERTPASVIKRVSDFALARDKSPIVVRKELPGFIWNRLQFAVLRECLHLLDEGVADIATIDAAVSEGLAARWLAAGPLATADLGGLETFMRAAEQLFPTLVSEGLVSRQLRERATAGVGFYDWTPASREEVEVMRAQAIEYARELSDRRSAIALRANPLSG